MTYQVRRHDFRSTLTTLAEAALNGAALPYGVTVEAVRVDDGTLHLRVASKGEVAQHFTLKIVQNLT